MYGFGVQGLSIFCKWTRERITHACLWNKHGRRIAPVNCSGVNRFSQPRTAGLNGFDLNFYSFHWKPLTFSAHLYATVTFKKKSDVSFLKTQKPRRKSTLTPSLVCFTIKAQNQLIRKTTSQKKAEKNVNVQQQCSCTILFDMKFISRLCSSVWSVNRYGINRTYAIYEFNTASCIIHVALMVPKDLQGVDEMQENDWLTYLVQWLLLV